MLVTSGIGSGDPDMVLIGELMEEMSRRPPAIGARKFLVEHYISVGWLEAASDNAKELENLAPGDSEILRFLQILKKKPELPMPEKLPAPPAPKMPTASTVEELVWDPKSGRYKKAAVPNLVEKKPEVPNVLVNDDLDAPRQDLITGYQALRVKAGFILADLMHLQALQKKANISPSKNTAKIQRIVDGQAELPTQLCNPRTTARAMRKTPKEATSIAIADMEEAIQWHKKLPGHSSGANTDTIRDALVKRKAALETALPKDLKVHCEVAIMHMEHEHLDRNYANTETMYGDEVKDIPRSNFYVTEDNYAWDLDELVAAIKAGSGVLRNPLSKQMFTPKDVKGIYASTGQTSGCPRSRAKGDIQRIPELEQEAIDGLKCPAKDSHTGQAYDSSVGEAVRDAKGNRVCFHKTGDFIGQAAAHLRQNQGVAPDADKCEVM